MWPFSRAPAVHIPRELPKPDKLSAAIRHWHRATVLPSNHGVDPYREAARRAAFANGPYQISQIARAESPLPLGQVAIHPRRRTWRFRACDVATSRCVFERYVESETPEGAVHEGRKLLERDAKKLGIGGSQALVGSVLAI